MLDSVNNFDRSRNTDRFKGGTLQGYCHMPELLVKTAHVVSLWKVMLIYSAAKGFHLYAVSSLISVDLSYLFIYAVLTVSTHILLV